MTKPSLPQDQKPARYPLSFTQEWFLTLDQGDDGGPFGRRYLLVSPVRITGLVDLAVLRGALDDVVARHELLRTLVVRDADPPYQLVCPPCPVPLEVRDLPPVTGTSRDMVIQELIVEAQAGTISAREVPLLHARLCRFDDRDSALLLTGDERDYDYKFHTSLQGKISKHLSLNLHFEYEFDNAILDPNARGSQRVTTTLGYGF